MGPYGVMMGIILVLTPVTCWLFTLGCKEVRTPLKDAYRIIIEKKYYLHILGYAVIIKWKALTDNLNEPLKIKTGNWTELIYTIEGNATLWIQQAFENSYLTEFLNFHYLFIYLFLIYITTVYFAYVGERDLTDKMTLNYLLIYAIAVPYYLFFNVEVTSSWIPGMDALLYHDSWYVEFYSTHDPLDNAVPSLHVAIPFGMLLLNWLHCKEKGIQIKEWNHYRYHLFILANTILFIFTIAYLGIHWLVDIPLGMFVGAIGALFIHYLQPRLRNDFGKTFKGVNRKKITTHAIFEGAVTLFLLALIMISVNYQEDNIDDRVSLRLGGGDTLFEIYNPLVEGQTMTSEIINLDDSNNLEYAIVNVEDSPEYMGDGNIDWIKIKKDFEVKTINSSSSVNEIVNAPDEWNLLILHNPDSNVENVIEIRVLNDYGDERYLDSLLLSLPSLWITSFVVFRLIRLNKTERNLFDSTPSHAWGEEE